MSHFTLLVVTDDKPDLDSLLSQWDETRETEPRWEHYTDAVGELCNWAEFAGARENFTPEELLKAYGEVYEEPLRLTDLGAVQRETTYNPDSKWDWWVVGGRWSGFFLHIDGTWVDQVSKHDWNLHGQRAEARRKAGAEWDRFHELTKGTKPVFWDDVLREHGVAPDGSSWEEEKMNAARTAYRDSPFKRALAGDEQFRWVMGDVAREFCLHMDKPRQAYCTNAQMQAGVTFAYLKDGVWHEKGQMGWFAMVANEVDQDAWAVEMHEMFDGLRDDACLTLLDLHI